MILLTTLLKVCSRCKYPCAGPPLHPAPQQLGSARGGVHLRGDRPVSVREKVMNTKHTPLLQQRFLLFRTTILCQESSPTCSLCFRMYSILSPSPWSHFILAELAKARQRETSSLLPSHEDGVLENQIKWIPSWEVRIPALCCGLPGTNFVDVLLGFAYAEGMMQNSI